MTHFRHIRFVVLVQVFLMWCAVSAFGHYRPGTGRWLERDPAQYADAMSLYQYVGSHPIDFLDTYGLDSVRPAGLLYWNQTKDGRPCAGYDPAVLQEGLDTFWNKAVHFPVYWQTIVDLKNMVDTLQAIEAEERKAAKGCDCVCIRTLQLHLHGKPNVIFIGSQAIDADDLVDMNRPIVSKRTKDIWAELARLKGMLCDGATIHIESCDVAKNSDRFLVNLQRALGTDKNIVGYSCTVYYHYNVLRMDDKNGMVKVTSQTQQGPSRDKCDCRDKSKS